MTELFNGKTALITGGSAGIGREFAMQLHALGANIVVVARRLEKLQQLCSELNNIRTNSARFIECDLTSNQNEIGLPVLLEYIKNKQIDILINNAGIGSFGNFDELSKESEVGIVKLNVLATTEIAWEAIKQMKKRHSGMIVFVASIAAFQPLPYMATYSASKAFNFIQAMALREELKAHNIRVLAVCPGPTETEFFGVARVPGTMTGKKRDDVKMVVSKSIDALVKNSGYVVTGRKSKLMALGSWLMPIKFSTWIVKKVLDPVMRSVQK
jgi:uncharacterized protein